MLQRRLVVEIIAVTVGIEKAEDHVVVVPLFLIATGAETLHEGTIEQRPGGGDAAVERAEVVEVELLVGGEALERAKERLCVELRMPLGVTHGGFDIEIRKEIGAEFP